MANETFIRFTGQRAPAGGDPFQALNAPGANKVAVKNFKVTDGYQTANPTPGAQPPIVTFITYVVAGEGQRTVMIPNAAPQAADIVAAIQADQAFRTAVRAITGTV